MKISVYFVLKSLSESEVPDDFNSFEIDDWKAIERVFDATQSFNMEIRFHASESK